MPTYQVEMRRPYVGAEYAVLEIVAVSRENAMRAARQHHRVAKWEEEGGKRVLSAVVILDAWETD